MFYRLSGIALLLTANVALHGANILNVTGTNSFSFTGQAAFVVGWTQTATYSGVTVSMPLQDNTPTPLIGVEGTVYLMNSIGPGTTAANQVTPPFTISSLGSSFAPVTLFGLTLAPGTYYVVVVPTNSTPMSASPEGGPSVNTVVTPGTSVTTLGAGVPGALAGYPPASTVVLTPPGNIYLTVTGTLVPVLPTTPAPSTWILVLLGIASLAVFQALRARSSRA